MRKFVGVLFQIYLNSRVTLAKMDVCVVEFLELVDMNKSSMDINIDR